MFVYLIGKHIPLSYVVVDSAKKVTFNMNAVIQYMVSDDPVTPSLFILGLSPWMSAMILAKIIMVIRHPNAKRDRANRGRSLTITLTILFSIIQAWVALQSLSLHYFSPVRLYTELFVLLEMITGSLLVVWMAEKNSLYGIGGPSAIILMNILLNMVGIIKNGLNTIQSWNTMTLFSVIVCLIYIIFVVILSVIFSLSERRIPVYKTMINNEFSDTSYLTIKLSPLGTLVLMYIMALFSLLRSIISAVGFFFQKSSAIMYLVANWRLDTPFGLIVFCLLYLTLSILLTLLLMNPKEMSENFLKAGDCLAGIRPGKTTERYLRRLLVFYTLTSSLVMLVMIVTPLIISMQIQGDTELFSLPFTVLILGNIILNVMDEIHVRTIGRRYEKMSLI